MLSASVVRANLFHRSDTNGKGSAAEIKNLCSICEKRNAAPNTLLGPTSTSTRHSSGHMGGADVMFLLRDDL